MLSLTMATESGNFWPQGVSATWTKTELFCFMNCKPDSWVTAWVLHNSMNNTCPDKTYTVLSCFLKIWVYLTCASTAVVGCCTVLLKIVSYHTEIRDMWISFVISTHVFKLLNADGEQRLLLQLYFSIQWFHMHINSVLFILFVFSALCRVFCLGLPWNTQIQAPGPRDLWDSVLWPMPTRHGRGAPLHPKGAHRLHALPGEAVCGAVALGRQLSTLHICLQGKTNREKRV